MMMIFDGFKLAISIYIFHWFIGSNEIWCFNFVFIANRLNRTISVTFAQPWIGVPSIAVQRREKNDNVSCVHQWECSTDSTSIKYIVDKMIPFHILMVCSNKRDSLYYLCAMYFFVVAIISIVPTIPILNLLCIAIATNSE